MTLDPLLLGEHSDFVIRGDARAYVYLSRCGTFRFALGRTWRPGAPTLTVCMLNPSTADERVVDPTVRKCLHFAQRDGFGGLVVVNLFSIRATDPHELAARLENDEPIMHHLDDFVLRIALLSDVVVAAWGRPPWKFVRERAAEVRAMRTIGPWECFGKTKDGDPRHPCYLANATRREVWP